MKIKILYILYLFKTFFKFNNRKRLRVIHYHDILKFDENKFKNQLLHIKKKWEFITPSDFELFINNHKTLEKDSVLLTFDDGFSSNRVVAESILHELNIKAIFFIVYDYIDIHTNQHDLFYHNRFYPNHTKRKIPPCSGNMKTEDLLWLINNGHMIGYHTKSHSRLSELNMNELKIEIDLGLDNLEKNIKKKIKHFSYPFGDINSINEFSYNYIQSKFEYIYTGIRGDNNKYKFKKGIFRDVIQVYDKFNLIDILLDGLIDFKYSLKFNKYKKFQA